MASPKVEEAFEFCMREMFLRVGEDYPNKDFTSKDDWYTMRSWTIEEEGSFKKWMVAYLRKKLRWTKNRSEKEVGWFMLQWAWTNCQPMEIKVIKQ